MSTEAPRLPLTLQIQNALAYSFYYGATIPQIASILNSTDGAVARALSRLKQSRLVDFSKADKGAPLVWRLKQLS